MVSYNYIVLVWGYFVFFLAFVRYFAYSLGIFFLLFPLFAWRLFVICILACRNYVFSRGVFFRYFALLPGIFSLFVFLPGVSSSFRVAFFVI